MDTITIRTRKSKAVYCWLSKEWGSWEDENKNPDHVCAILQKFGRKLTITIEQAKELIRSGNYTITAYNDDELEGGKLTKKVIKGIVNDISQELANAAKQ